MDHRWPTPQQVEKAKTKRGGWTKATLASWGVPWPPPPGWRRKIEQLRMGRRARVPHGWSSPISYKYLKQPEEPNVPTDDQDQAA